MSSTTEGYKLQHTQQAETSISTNASSVAYGQKKSWKKVQGCLKKSAAPCTGRREQLTCNWDCAPSGHFIFTYYADRWIAHAPTSNFLRLTSPSIPSTSFATATSRDPPWRNSPTCSRRRSPSDAFSSGSSIPDLAEPDSARADTIYTSPTAALPAATVSVYTATTTTSFLKTVITADSFGIFLVRPYFFSLCTLSSNVFFSVKNLLTTISDFCVLYFRRFLCPDLRSSFYILPIFGWFPRFPPPFCFHLHACFCFILFYSI